MLTNEHIQILQHAIGADKYGRGGGYRNHFCAGGSDEQLCRDLVEAGLMQRHMTTSVFPDYNCSVTDAGKQYVREHSPKPPKLTRAQKRYRAFCRADTGRPFIEFLKDMAAYKRDTGREYPI